MKKRNLLSLLAFFLSVGFENAEAQTVVNKEWEAFNGIPDSIAYSSSVLDGQGNLIVTTNAITTGQQANLLVMKYERNGNLLWQDNYNGVFNGKDYGIAVTTDNANNVYVAGASQTGAISSDYIIRKYNSTGTLQWNATYSGSGTYNAPTAIAVDNSGNVYVTGVTFSLSTQTDYSTLKLNASGAQQWVQTYNYANLYDVPAGIEVNPTTGKVYVTGASASANNNYDYATVEYDAATGSQLNVNRISAPGTGFDKATAIERDNAGNIYITGQAFEQSTNSYDIKTIKLNSSLAVQWIQTYDKAGLEDLATTIDVDNAGNVFVGGYLSTTDEGRNFITLKYDVNGNLVWEREYDYSGNSEDDEVKKLDIDGFGNISIVGTISKGQETDILFIRYNNGGDIEIVKSFENAINSTDKATDIKVNNLGNIYVTGVVENVNSNGNENAIIKYSVFDKDLTYEYTPYGDPYLIKNQIIVRFDTSALIVNNFMNIDIVWGKVEDFFKPTTINQLQSKLPYDLSRATVHKIFQRLTPNYSQTTNKTGDMISLPPFWATLKLVFAQPFNQGEEKVLADSLETLTSIIEYAHAELLTNSLSGSNDPNFLAGDQQSLYGDTTIQSIFYSGINAVKAWDIEVGDSSVRVGIVDYGMYHLHEDFRFNPSYNVFRGGYNYITGQDLFTSPNYVPHGTMVAGLVGAIRNNSKGIAGVAGGDGITPGVSMYGMAQVNASQMAAAIVEEDLQYNPLNYGLDIINISRQVVNANSADIELLREALHFANRKGTKIVLARGNTAGNVPIYPAIIEDKWSISVGGSQFDGSLYRDSLSYGSGMDVIAPGILGMSYSCSIPGPYEDPGDGSSMAAPLVAGTAALLLQHHDTQGNIYQELAPEDVEELLQRSGKNYPIDSVNTSGYGLIDAEKCLNLISGDREIIHFGTDQFGFSLPNNVSMVQIDTFVPIKLLNMGYENVSGQVFGDIDYLAHIYKITATISHNTNGKNILAAWGLHSKSSTFPYYIYNPNTQKNELRAVEDIQVVSYNANEAIVEGYLYKLYDVDTTNGYLNVGWLPQSPNYGLYPSINLHYSLYLGSPLEVDKALNSHNILVYPNPTNEQENHIVFSDNLAIYENCKIELCDITGRVVKEVYNDRVTGNQITINLGDWVSGFYLYKITVNDNSTIIKKFIKQ